MKFSKIILLLLTSLCLTLLAFGSESDDKDWPRWRGNKMDSKVSNSGTFEEGKNYSLKVRWKRTLGSGYSSISVVGDKAVTMFSDSTFDYVTMLDANSGEELWRHKIDSTYLGHDGSHNGPISTPTVDGNKVFALGPKGQFLALDLKTGKQLWNTNLVDDHKAVVPFYGFSSSPIVDGSMVILETGGPEKTISAFNKDNGELLWSTGNDTVNHQSPILLDIAGQKQLLCIGDKYLYGMEPETGKTLWEYHHNGGWVSMNPVVVDNNKIFLQYKRTESILLQINASDSGFVAQELWKNRNIRLTYDTPVFQEGHLYGYSSRFLTCVESDSGKSVWKSRKPGDGFVILVDGYLVLLTKKGTLHVAKASPEGYQELASTKVFDGIAWTPVSFANGRIYARSLTEIAAIDIERTDQITEAKDQGLLPGSKFAEFVKKVESAADSKKAALIDEFMKSQKEFPIIEGDDLVHFIYRDKANDVALVGDLIGFRNDQEMKQIAGTDFFYFSMKLPAPDLRFNYGFTIDFEKNVIDSLNSRSFTGIFGPASWAALPKWQEPAHLAEPAKDVARGRLDTLRHESKVNESNRRIDVYLPAGYDKSDRRYEVAYVHLGRSAQDEGHWQNTLDNVIGKSVEPIIVVFIPSLPNTRGSEYSRDKKDAYAKMLKEEVIPLIDGKYRTIAKAEARANIAFGFSGYAAWYTTFKNPGTFGKVATQSFFTMESGLNELKPIILAASEHPLEIYYEWGLYDFRSPLELWGVPATSKRFTSFLKDKGYRYSGGVVNDSFDWPSWRNRTDKILQTFFPLKKKTMK